VETASPAVVGQKSAWPTRKWWAATITGLGAIATLLVQAGGFTPAVWIALIGAVVQAVVTYLLPNADTPGGVPLRS
jgi:hypothetical protein